MLTHYFSFLISDFNPLKSTTEFVKIKETLIILRIFGHPTPYLYFHLSYGEKDFTQILIPSKYISVSKAFM